LDIKVKEMKIVDIDEIKPHDKNWKSHPVKQKRMIRESMREVGFITPLIVNKRTMRILDGHLRYEYARILGLKEVPVVFIDVDEEQEKKILLFLDTVSQESSTDEERWLALSRELEISSVEISNLIKQYEQKLNPVVGELEEDIPLFLKEYNYVLVVFKDKANYLKFLSKYGGGKKYKVLNMVNGDGIQL